MQRPSPDPTGCQQALAAALSRERLLCPLHPSGVALGGRGGVHEQAKLFVQVHGRTRLRLPHRALSLAPGSCLLMPRHHVHEEVAEPDAAGYCTLILVLRHRPARLLRTSSRQGRPTIEREWSCAAVDWQDALIHLLDEWLACRRDGRADQDAYRRSLDQTLAHCGDRLLDSARVGQPPDPLIVRALQQIERGYTDPTCSLHRIAAACGVSDEHLARRFRRHRDGSIGTYIRQRRLDLACDLLLRSDLSVALVARTTGFGSATYFARCFRAQHGSAPQAWRRSRGLLSHAL
ncbi:MAG: helix-turn-helix domain-containing protein [Planctomycetota bacterium]